MIKVKWERKVEAEKKTYTDGLNCNLKSISYTSQTEWRESFFFNLLMQRKKVTFLKSFFNEVASTTTPTPNLRPRSALAEMSSRAIRSGGFKDKDVQLIDFHSPGHGKSTHTTRGGKSNCFFF